MGQSRDSDHPWLVVSLEGIVATAVPEARIEAIAEAARIDPTDAYERLWASGFADACYGGEFSFAQMVAGIRTRLGVDLTEAHLMGLWSLAYEPDLDVIAALSAVSDVRVGLIADETPLFQAGFEAYLPEIEMLADGSWLSCEQESLTNDASFYRAVAGTAQMEVMPIFITRTASQRRAAEAAGWRVFPDVQAALMEIDRT